MKTRFIATVACWPAVLGCALFAQSPQPTVSTPSDQGKSLEPTETQKLKLENAQLRAQVALAQLQPLQQQYQQRIAELFEMCERVKKENGWDKGVTCNPQTLKFSPPQKSETPAGKPPGG